MRYTTLIPVAELAAHSADPQCVVCDCRHDLADPAAGRAAYATSHIPGARFLHLDDDLSGTKTGRNGRHPLPDHAVLARKLGALGIDNETQVVAYDASGGCFAARLWWLLRWLGHERVAVLDGGWPAWLAAGQPVTAAAPAVTPTTFTADLQPQLAIDADFVVRHLATTDFQVLDARSPDRFRGENETLDPVAGHIPGAVNRCFKDNLEANGRFKSPGRLREEWQATLAARSPAQIIHQCGSGVTACHNILAMEHAGYTGSRLYPGSWSEWVADPSRPVTR